MALRSHEGRTAQPSRPTVEALRLGPPTRRIGDNLAAGVKLPASVRELLKKGGHDRVPADSEIATVWRQLA